MKLLKFSLSSGSHDNAFVDPEAVVCVLPHGSQYSQLYLREMGKPIVVHGTAEEVAMFLKNAVTE